MLAAALTALSLMLSAARLPKDAGRDLRRAFYVQGALTGSAIALAVLLGWHAADRPLVHIGLLEWWGPRPAAAALFGVGWAALLVATALLLSDARFRVGM